MLAYFEGVRFRCRSTLLALGTLAIGCSGEISSSTDANSGAAPVSSASATPPAPSALVSATPLATGSRSGSPKTSASPPDENDPRFEADLLAIAAEYQSFYRSDGTTFSPFDCRAPVHPAQASRASDGGHGRKLYTLFIKDFTAYAKLSGVSAAASTAIPLHGPVRAMPQIIVKEAWTPVLADRYREECRDKEGKLPSYLDHVTVDGKNYAACELAALFVMYRPERPERAVDDGWVYGTVQYDVGPGDRDGQTRFTPRVTSAGKLASCARCHREAPHGRLFGLPKKAVEAR